MKKTCSFIIITLFSLAITAQINQGYRHESPVAPQKKAAFFHPLFDTAKHAHSRSHSFSPHAPKAPTFVALYDSIYYWNSYDSVTQKFVKQATDKEVDMQFDSHGNVLRFLGMDWVATKWEKDVMEFFNYNSAGFITGVYYENWLGTMWGNKEKVTFTYDANNNLTSKLEEDSLSKWTNLYLFTFTYDSHNNMTSQIDQNWGGSEWQNMDKYTYKYDANNNLISEIYEYGNGTLWYNEDEYICTYNAANLRTDSLELNWYDTAWTNSYNYSMSYDKNNNRDSMSYEYWESYNSSWTKEWLYVYSYDLHNNLLSDTSKEWNGIQWSVGEDAYNYTYDTNNNRISYLYQYYDGISWENESRIFYTYNPADSLTSMLTQNGETTGWADYQGINNYYDAQNIKQANVEKYYYYESSHVEDGDSTVWYFRLASTGGGTAINGNMFIYPNPSDGNFTVVLAVVDNNSLFQIYNIIGQKVYETTVNANQTTLNVDISNYPRGMYVCRVLSPGGSVIAQGKLVNAK